MGAVIDQHFLDGHIGLGEDRVGGLLVANLPFEDVVGMFARAMRTHHLVLDVLAQDRRVGIHRFEGIDDAGQCFVFHIDQFGGVRGDVAVFGDDESHFLVLEQHLFLGQDRLHVAGQRRHVVQAERLEVGGGQHRNDTRQGLGAAGVDALDARMGVRRADEVAKQHARQFQVVDIAALALGEANVLDPLALAAHALEFLGTFGAVLINLGLVVHSAASWKGVPLILAAAYWIALTMLT